MPGAIIGGLALGVIETFGAAYISVPYKDGFAFLVLVAFQGHVGEENPQPGMMPPLEGVLEGGRHRCAGALGGQGPGDHGVLRVGEAAGGRTAP